MIGLVRLVPEMMALGNKRLYLLVAGIDLILALLTLTAASGLRRGKAWGPGVALRAAGLVLATSLGWGILLAPEVLHDNTLLIPRVLFYVIAIALWPCAIWTFVKAASPESRKSLWVTLAASLAIGAVLMGAQYMAYR
jgi:hypothetical protein